MYQYLKEKLQRKIKATKNIRSNKLVHTCCVTFKNVKFDGLL